MTFLRPVFFGLTAMLAASGASAYEKPDSERQAGILVSEADINPGIDFMITGPSGPSKEAKQVEPTKAPEPVERRRMIVQH